jgi:5-methylcytosine-specific restriction endonuclease McrA
LADSWRHRARRRAIFHRDGYRCVYCGRVFDPRHLSVDHVEPRVKRGDHSAGNLVTACTACNRQKGGRAAWEFLRNRPQERNNFLRHATHVWPRLRRAVAEAARDDAIDQSA